MNCLLCQLPLTLNIGICHVCASHIIRTVPVCNICGLARVKNNQPCVHCQFLLPNWHQIVSVADYDMPLISKIKQFKFYNKTEFGHAFARLMMQAWLKDKWTYNLTKPDIVTCVPLHRWRYWSRGYNQTELLAKPIARWMNVEYSPFLLQRKRSGADQKNLSKVQRSTNIENVFGCKMDLTGKKVALIDDVVTTGSTVKEATKTLLEKGASEVIIICLCRTSL